jgi:hypothetical protein
MRKFAGVLVDLVAPQVASVGSDRQWRQAATLGNLSGSERFVGLLASAVNATIVGITNERLRAMLEQPMRLRREAGRPDTFWQSLRIVFLGRGLLDSVSDERASFDPPERRGKRRQEAVWARSAIWDLLKQSGSRAWEMYECPYVPLLNGALLEFDDGRRVVHLLVRRTRLPRAEHVYVELDDVGGRFAAVFEDIIRECASADLNVPIGFPENNGFTYRHTRNQADVLLDDVDDVKARADDSRGWLPMVLVLTPQRNGSEIHPIMQLRTDVNSARELSRVSHLAGHVLEEDLERPGSKPDDLPSKHFALGDPTPLSAARRVVQEVSADDLFSAIRPLATSQYLYRDKEHLHFFIYALDLPEGIRFPGRAEMREFRLSDLLTIRANQVLRSAAEFCRKTNIPAARWLVTAKIIALNLRLHDQPELAQSLLDLPGSGRDRFESTARAMEDLVTARVYPSVADPSKDIEITGLAGWQHREFFSVLVGLYADLGITGAAELRASIDQDERKSAAVSELKKLYRSEDKIAAVPMEL